VTFHPLFDWTHEQVDAYTEEHGLPVHPLYAENYLSIGCATCTTPVRPGEDRRAGRWRHLARRRREEAGVLQHQLFRSGRRHLGRM
jgi:3'-phosphoadenosine 5'-phosphosulfate sulfotransferase (PAPS reductase)/FAD synthetase